ncbi:MAG: MFS transporter [Ancrocorticia sp.]
MRTSRGDREDSTSPQGPAAGSLDGIPNTPSHTPLLLATQTLFNIGFYAVVPFIAGTLTSDFGLTATAVGLVLGIRTFAQQGLFLLGGALADRFSARSVILAGCAVRIAGFATLAASLWSGSAILWLFIAGTVLTGFGGALFSPSLNTLIATAEAHRIATSQRPPRITLFAWLTITGEIGAVTGPIIGAWLLDWGFAAVAAWGAGFFVAIAAVLWLFLPRLPRAAQPHAPEPSSSSGAAMHPSWPALRDRNFVIFASLHASDLVAYNQLYLALPLELTRLGLGADAVAMMFVWVSIVTFGAQLPLARWAAHVGAGPALRAGYLVTATGFLVLGGAAVAAPPRTWHIAFVAVSVTCLIAGHLIAHPTAQSTVPKFAGAGPTGTYFGLLASLGGIAVLLASLATGALFDTGTSAAASTSTAPSTATTITSAAAHTVTQALPWLFLAAISTVAAIYGPRRVTGRHDYQRV